MLKKILSKLEDRWINYRNYHLLKRGYFPHIINYNSFGNTHQTLVQLRVVLTKDSNKFNIMHRGFATFTVKQAPNARVNVWLGEEKTSYNLVTDRGGYITKLVDCKLPVGWNDVRIELAGDYYVLHKNKRIEAEVPPEIQSIESQVLTICTSQATGIISDIDDTILVSNTPSTLIALREMLFTSPYRRKPVPGMVHLYQQLLEKIDNSFLLYLSASPWNQFTFLKHFILTSKFPFGPIILQDIGPDETKVFESTRTHKIKKLEELFNMFSNTKWILIGDDGQYDVEIYKRMAILFPERIQAILIRQLSVPHRILSTPLLSLIPTPTRSPKNQLVPIIYANNGFEFEHLVGTLFTGDRTAKS